VASGSPLKGGEQQSTSFATIPLSCSRAPQKLPKKEFELFEHPARGYKLREFSNFRQGRAQGTLLKAGQMTGALSFAALLLVRFLCTLRV
jgi:hypothetical protein